MNSMLNAQMIQARHADWTRDALLAMRRAELRELHGPGPQRGKQLRRLTARLASSVTRATRRPAPFFRGA